MVLHLRYPNAHTHWFSSLMLYLFLEVNVDRFREVMTKVLLERFLVHRPHPWGALVTFIELLRNVKYEFWSQEFIRVAPEVTLLLETVSLIVPRCLTYAEHTICRWQNQFSNPRDVTAVDCLRYLFDISSLVLVLFILGSVLFFFFPFHLLISFCRNCIVLRPPHATFICGMFQKVYVANSNFAYGRVLYASHNSTAYHKCVCLYIQCITPNTSCHNLE